MFNHFFTICALDKKMATYGHLLPWSARPQPAVPWVQVVQQAVKHKVVEWRTDHGDVSRGVVVCQWAYHNQVLYWRWYPLVKWPGNNWLTICYWILLSEQGRQHNGCIPDNSPHLRIRVQPATSWSKLPAPSHFLLTGRVSTITKISQVVQFPC